MNSKRHFLVLCFFAVGFLVILVYKFGTSSTSSDVKHQLFSASVEEKVHLSTSDQHSNLIGAFSQDRRNIEHDRPFEPMMMKTSRNYAFDYKSELKKLNDAKVAADDPRLVQIIRDYYIIPPSTEAYKLTKSNSFDYSMGQAPFVDSRLNYLEGGFYVECGALDGEIGSNSLFFEKVRKWNGLLVEADPENFRLLQAKHRKAFSINACLSGQPYPSIVRQSPSVNNGSVHYSFDYAQQVFYPHYAQQVGPMYFKTPRKCGCFGVCCESSGSQIFYLVDEEIGAAVGKGANSVVSMLHHHFEHLGYGEKRVSLHMDNCSGQNKNNAVIGYGMWRTMMGLHEEFEYSLMEAGHTKFSPDWHFGLWKVRWRHTTAETLEEIATSVSQSSRNGHNIPQLVDDPTKPVVFYDWTAYLKQFFKPLTGLKKYHHFRMSSLKPGIIFVKEYCNNSEIEINIFKSENVILTGTFPERVEIEGLDAKRQWYLHEEVAPLCSNTSACPMPTVPKPQAVKSTISKKKNLKLTFNKAFDMGRIVNEEGTKWIKDKHIRSNKVEVQCFPLYSMLLALNQSTVDFFTLDVEGEELNVLKTIPFKELDIKMMAVEYVNDVQGQKGVKQFVERQGYESMLQMSRADDRVNDIIFRKRGLSH